MEILKRKLIYVFILPNDYEDANATLSKINPFLDCPYFVFENVVKDTRHSLIVIEFIRFPWGWLDRAIVLASSGVEAFKFLHNLHRIEQGFPAMIGSWLSEIFMWNFEKYLQLVSAINRINQKLGFQFYTNV